MPFNVTNTTVITDDRLVQLTTGSTASRPGSPTTGMLFYDTTLGRLIVWNGSTWKEAINIPGGDIKSAWTFGRNEYGEMAAALSAFALRTSPVSVVANFNDWTQVSTGFGPGSNARATVFVKASGSAWSSGNNVLGQLGDGTTTNRSSPVSVVGGFTDWKQVSTSGYSSAGVRRNGTAWTWGFGFYGRLGDGTTSNRSSPVSVVGGFTDWVQVSSGVGQMGGIRSNGTAWCWGRSFRGQLGDGNTGLAKSSPVSVIGGFTDWVQIASGKYHMGAVRANGTAWTWGYNNVGQLGDGTTSNRSSPVSVVGGFTDWIQITAGVYQSAAIRSNGTAWCWGLNGQGQLGDGTTSSRSSPVSVVGGFTDWVQISSGLQHTGAIRANGTAWCWGDNVQGQLGNSNRPVDASSPVSVVGGFTDWIQISAGTNMTGAIRAQPSTQLVRATVQRNTF